MKILKNDLAKNILLNEETTFKMDLGWEENMRDYEKEVLKTIINPTENFETIRYTHKPYFSSNNIEQTDIWFYFHFYNGNPSDPYTGGLDYQYAGITPQENQLLLRQASQSFFRLEFYKVPSGETPNRINRKLVFSRNLSVPLGEKVFYTELNEYIHVPVFVGSNYRNKENMYLFWFQDDTVLNGSIYSGETFYMTARFFNTKYGSIYGFTNKPEIPNAPINEDTDLYYEVIIDKSDYTYNIYQYDGVTGNRVGQTGTPIHFYETIGGDQATPSTIVCGNPIIISVSCV